jgi:hypothetical protein
LCREEKKRAVFTRIDVGTGDQMSHYFRRLSAMLVNFSAPYQLDLSMKKRIGRCVMLALYSFCAFD